jgi:hypothetical protein
MKRLIKVAALGVGMALIAAACGNDSSGGSVASADDPLVQAVVEDILSDDGSLTSDRGEAECFAGGVVGGIGGSRLAELGVTADNVGDLDEYTWSEDEARLIIDKMFDCMDPAGTFVEDLSVDGMTDEQTACLAGAFDEDTLKDFFVGGLTGEQPTDFFATIGEAMSSCGLDAFG